jgi:hypothetical protein
MDQHLLSKRDNRECPACEVINQLDLDSHPQLEKTGNGYAYRGQIYHVHDFIHFIAEKGPCATGQIVAFEKGSGVKAEVFAAVNLLGRMDNIQHNRPRDYIKDEVRIL